MRWLLLIFLLSGCSGTLKVGATDESKQQAEQMKVMASAVMVHDANIKTLGNSYIEIIQRVEALERKTSVQKTGTKKKK